MWWGEATFFLLLSRCIKLSVSLLLTINLLFFYSHFSSLLEPIYVYFDIFCFIIDCWLWWSSIVWFSYANSHYFIVRKIFTIHIHIIDHRGRAFRAVSKWAAFSVRVMSCHRLILTLNLLPTIYILYYTLMITWLWSLITVACSSNM
jgi:hypothetical protein